MVIVVPLLRVREILLLKERERMLVIKATMMSHTLSCYYV